MRKVNKELLWKLVGRDREEVAEDVNISLSLLNKMIAPRGTYFAPSSPVQKRIAARLGTDIDILFPKESK